ncbi:MULTISPECIES: chlorite dismutase family protein [Cryobacterium]|uniref:chlorite dismutase family protein n=1 Tax=Cryobacterium TaxID=69578 RepID=UPI000AB14F4D|nr:MULTISPECIES: chlorite dismutase family protein [Cryobacterium]
MRGAVSNQRYTTAAELTRLNAQSPALGRPDATVASLIPITKSNAWWELAQDERRAIFEETSHHIRRAMDYLPAVARKLHHCRDLGGPFDFLTWFEFAPSTRPHSTIYWLSCGGRRNGPLSSARSRCA